MQEIPAVNLKKQYAAIQMEVDEAIALVLAKGSFGLGDEVSAFEQEFASYCNASHTIGVASGTDALQIALSSLGIGTGDEVITSSHTAVATVVAIEKTGARPILVDIDLHRFTLDPQQIKQTITANTRAIIPVHLYGCPAELEPILKIACENNLHILEDCAQAHGASYKNKTVGTWGQISAFSFYPTKNIGAFGDGGAIVTNDVELAKKIRLLRQYGWEERYISSIKGMNSRLDELQASILRIKLRYLEKWNAKRRELANLYHDTLARVEEITLPHQPADSQHVFHQYVIRTAKRDELKIFLKERGIHTLIHYPVPIHLQPAYKNLGYSPGDFPNTELATKEILSLPMYPELNEEEIHKVSEAVCKFFKKSRES